ncbi:MAG: NADH-quinone oxidoreductase subunit N, partial [Verrucomicrobiota bacterium]|nr:NADH-quinone oxidoreductase subunit N [Verrucomicrobiota bacterium]
FSAAARAGGNYGLVWLVALALFGSLISLYYYLTILKAIFAQAPTSDVTVGRRDFVSQFTVAALAFAVLFLGILPETLVRLINRSLL